ncbi:ABC transporter permease [Fulvivirgaceae bacterium PWU20]|uniref:ABC transporter permease n=2 Tax=Chryseosolibacter indicus TaxID=2782351 RepID=A0ABS5VTK1_9BACT|nr:ABC transporter permease [Chryseosolibacter indicus]
MYQSYFKIAWRNLVKNKGYSSINIVGLAIGMAVAMSIALWVWDEVSFDSYFTNRERLAQVMVSQTNEGVTYTHGTVQMPLGDALRNGYASDFNSVSLASGNNSFMLTHNETKLPANGMWVQHEFSSMFTLKMLSGNYAALNNPSTMLISSSLAKSLFGEDDALNKSIRIDTRFDLVVGGVYEDFPYNTTFQGVKMLLPWDNKENWLNRQTAWTNHCGQLFVLLNDAVDLQGASEKIKAVPTSHIDKWKEEVMLHPMSDLHLYNAFENGKASGGRIQFVWLFGVIGVFVLLLACINFMNLSTARSEKRAKEVGIRKTIGSIRNQIVTQFLSESIMLSTLSLVISLVLVELSLPYFNMIADKRIAVPWESTTFWLIIITFTLFTGLIAGSYPAFYLSAFKPVKILKGAFIAGRSAVLPRKVLVVVQFTVSLTLIIGTMIIFWQIQHARERSAGYNRDGLITVGMYSTELRKNVEVIKNELLQKGVIESMALSSQSPAHFSNNNGIEWRGKDPGLVVFFRNVGVTPDYGKTVGWKLIKGRDFSPDLPSDSSAIIVNKNAARIMGFEDPLGEVVTFRGKQFTVIGVTEDMITQSPYASSEPSFFITDDWMGFIVMRLSESVPTPDALDKVQKVFKKHDPASPFNFSFVNADYAKKYSTEERIGNLSALFAILAIFISCLGLFGLASFVAEQRTKEIGIRKVLGATVVSIWKMLSKEFVMLTFIACGIAIPISFILMDKWLVQYQYRITITWQLFAIAALGILMLTLITVSFQAIKAAWASPVKNLRSE